jgi:hypothetical protein
LQLQFDEIHVFLGEKIQLRDFAGKTIVLLVEPTANTAKTIVKS